MSGARRESAAWVGHIVELQPQTAAGRTRYREFLRSRFLSAGTYVLPAGAADPQRPHREDEVYLIWAGEATLEIDGAPHPVGAGSIAFVPAERPHRFVDVRKDLMVVVLFAPPETKR